MGDCYEIVFVEQDCALSCRKDTRERDRLEMEAGLCKHARAVQQVTRAEIHILKVLGLELGTPTPVNWVEIFRRRLSLWQRQPLLQNRRIFLQCRRRSSLVVRITLPKRMSKASASVVGPTASQVGATAWFASTVLWIWLGALAMR